MVAIVDHLFVPGYDIYWGNGQLAMIKEVFELFDTDGQHQLDEEELALAIYTLGFSQNRHFQVCHRLCMSELMSTGLNG
jgi:hypothetical protein